MFEEPRPISEVKGERKELKRKYKLGEKRQNVKLKVCSLPTSAGGGILSLKRQVKHVQTERGKPQSLKYMTEKEKCEVDQNTASEREVAKKNRAAVWVRCSLGLWI